MIDIIKRKFVNVVYVNSISELRAWVRRPDRKVQKTHYTYVDYSGANVGDLVIVATGSGMTQNVAVAYVAEVLMTNESALKESDLKETIASLSIGNWLEREQQIEEVKVARRKLDEMLKQMDDMQRYRQLAETVPEARELLNKLMGIHSQSTISTNTKPAENDTIMSAEAWDGEGV